LSEISDCILDLIL